MSLKSLALIGASLLVLGACSSSKIKERKEQRDKVAQSSKLFCEFINGEMFPDIDVAINIEMAKRCDFEKPFTMTQYNTRSDSTGIMYCCSVAPGKMVSAAPPAAAKKDLKKDDKSDSSDE